MQISFINDNFKYDKLPIEFRQKVSEWAGGKTRPVYAYYNDDPIKFALVILANERQGTFSALRLWDMGYEIALSCELNVSFDPAKIQQPV